MRLFVAVDLPQGIKDYLVEVSKQLPSDAAKLAIAKELHVTLKFLGDVPEEHIPDIERRLLRVFFRPFQTKLSATGMFDTSVIWGGVEPIESWRKLAKEVDRALVEYKNDYAEFTPHITFARIKRVIASEALKEGVQSIALDKRMFEVREFHLYQSIPGLEGHRFKILRTYPAQPL